MDKYIVIINRDGEMQKRVKPVLPRDKLFTEAFLQKLIFNEPRLLPTGEIDSDYSNLIPLGREVPVRSGAIDVLFVTPEGQICIVETKLWRNPHAHRTVVAQIIDYAKDLSSMSFLDFCNAVTGVKSEEAVGLLFKNIRKKYREFDEIELQENIQSSLSHGRFLLLIVGDEIRPEVALLTEAIHSAPHLEFNLALSELRFHRLGKNLNSQLLVIPQVVGRTSEKTRAIIEIRYKKEKPHVEVEPIGPDETIMDNKRFLRSLDQAGRPVFEAVLGLSESHNLPVHWGSKGFSLNVDVNGKHVVLCYGFPPKSMYKQSLYTDLTAIKRKIKDSADLVTSFRDKFKRTGIFIPAGSEMKLVIQQRMTEKQINEITELLLNLANSVKELGLVETDEAS